MKQTRKQIFLHTPSFNGELWVLPVTPLSMKNLLYVLSKVVVDAHSLSFKAWWSPLKHLAGFEVSHIIEGKDVSLLCSSHLNKLFWTRVVNCDLAKTGNSSGSLHCQYIILFLPALLTQAYWLGECDWVNMPLLRVFIWINMFWNKYFFQMSLSSSWIRLLNRVVKCQFV